MVKAGAEAEKAEAVSIWDDLEYSWPDNVGLDAVSRAIARGRTLERVAEIARGVSGSLGKESAFADALAELEKGEKEGG